jgi:hypothetical protein
MVNPDLSPYYTEDNLDIHRRMEESYRQSITLQQQYWNEADIDTRFFCGDQTLWQQLYGYGYLPLITRRQMQFNRIRRVINMPTGFQRRNRKTTIVIPNHTKDQQGADDWTGVIQYVNHKNDFYNILSDSFQGACVAGFNLLSFWMDYRSDPINGDIRCDNISYNGALVDPTFKKQDLSDANFIWTRKWMSKKQIKSLLPDREDEIDAMPYTANRDDKFIFLPENYQYGIRTLLPYDEYWYLDYREAKILVDMETGETKEWDGDNKSLKEFLKLYPTVKAVPQQKQTCRLAISVGNRVMYDGPNPYGIDRYPFIGTYAYFEPNIPYFALKMQGIVRGLRDAQFLYNRRKVIELDMLESQINSGIKYKESALIDPNDAFLSGQGRALALRDSANMDDVQIIPPPDVPQGILQLSQLMGQEIQEISGVNEELLGSSTDEKAGILSMLRQGAGLTTLQVLFDQLDMTQKLAGALCMDLVRTNFTPKKVEQILGRQPSEEFYTKLFPEYNCSVEEGSLTINQKQMQFQQAIQLQELGVNVPPSYLIDIAQLQNKKELIDAIEAQNQAQEQQNQAQVQQAMQSQEVLNQTLIAKAESDHALAQERLNKVGLDAALNVERLQRAQEERDQGTLAKIKGVKELETMDISHLQQLINLYQSLKEPTMDPMQGNQEQPEPAPAQNAM